MTMRNDATRLRIPTKDPRRPRAVVARQGLALLDTDLDQQSSHQLNRIETETADTLGPTEKLLVRTGSDGFHILPGASAATFKIGAGHGFLGGWLVENTSECTNATQPHPRLNDGVASPSSIGIKALVRFVDPVEDPMRVDRALRDAQASGLSIVDWQVFPFPLGSANAATCASTVADAKWQVLIAPSTGTLTVIEQAATASTDPCTLTPAGGFNRMENLHYRFEVHGGIPDSAFPDIDGPRFMLDKLQVKFSRRNASVMAGITKVSGTEITVGAPPLDPLNWFAPGQYAELVSIHDDVDPRAALKKVRMYRVALAVDDRVVLEEPTAGDIATVGADGNGGWFLRLWNAFPNGDGVTTVAAVGGATQSQDLDTGDGLIVKLGQGTFRRGDYWSCDARADGSVGWPRSGNVPQAMKPHGPEVRYASIAAMNGQSNAITFDDCRVPFATLSDRILVYRGGDGQGLFSTAVAGMEPLPGKLGVGVMRGENPVPGATVKWTYIGPAGGASQIDGMLCDAANSPQTVTDANGLAEVTWSLDAARQSDIHQVQASLVASGLNLVVPPIKFIATFETAARTAYSPGRCADLAGVDNVQDALDTLCQRPSGIEHCVTVGPGGTLSIPPMMGTVEFAKALGKFVDKSGVLCVCFLPGVHEMKEMEFGPHLSGLQKLKVLRISGCGAATTVTAPSLLFQGLQTIEIEDIRILVESKGKPDGCISFMGCANVLLDGCAFHGPYIDTGPLLAIRSFRKGEEPRHVSVKDCHIECLAFRRRQELATIFQPLGWPAEPQRDSPSRGMFASISRDIVGKALTLSEGDRKTMANRIGGTAKQMGLDGEFVLRRFLDELTLPRKGALLLENLLDRIRHFDLNSSTALAIFPIGCDIEIVSTTCIGDVSFYGLPDKVQHVLIENELRTRQPDFAAGKVRFINEAGRAICTGNIFTRLTLSTDMAEQVRSGGAELNGVIETFTLTGNHFLAASSQLVARYINLSGNAFEYSLPSVDAVIAESLTFVGNHAPIASDHLLRLFALSNRNPATGMQAPSLGVSNPRINVDPPLNAS